MPVGPRPVKRYHVFLASPGDMVVERQVVRALFERQNTDVFGSRDLEFLVVDWENDSDIGLGRAQALITTQTLARCRDSLVLFIGLLGQRFGTPTGGHESGTEEEFRTVLRYRREDGSYPEIKWFFRSRPSRSSNPG